MGCYSGRESATRANADAEEPTMASCSCADLSSGTPLRDKRMLIGTWLYANDDYKIYEQGGGLIWEEGNTLRGSLIEDGEWMLAQLPSLFIRVKLGPSDGECISQCRAKDADWPPPMYAIREGAVKAGTVLVTRSTTQMWNPGYDYPMGTLGTETLIEAAGPPVVKMNDRVIPTISGCVQMWDLRIQGQEDSSWAEFIPGVTRAHETQKYYDLPSIYAALSNNETILLKGSWMQQQAANHFVLPRRQDLPTDAAWEPLPCVRLIDRRRVLMVAVSYCWVSPEHPDPKGEQLQTLARCIYLRLGEQNLPFNDLAFFFDWCSLLQKPRTETQEIIFKTSLKSVNLWFGHVMVMCWLLTRPPTGTLAYELRGWPIFERGISSFIKDSSKVLDLGNLDEDRITWWSLVDTCTSTRSPPTAPAAFAEELKQKKFTNGADCEMVGGMYTRAFEEIMRTLRKLEFLHLDWGAKEFVVLAEALPACEALESLELSINKPGRDGLEALANALPLCSRLDKLRLESCELDDEQAVLICEALASCTKITSIYFSSNNINPAGIRRIAGICPRIPMLEFLVLSGNNVGEEGTAALVEMIPKCFKLRYVEMKDCDMPDEQKRSIEAAWLQQPMNSRLRVIW